MRYLILCLLFLFVSCSDSGNSNSSSEDKIAKHIPALLSYSTQQYIRPSLDSLKTTLDSFQKDIAAKAELKVLQAHYEKAHLQYNTANMLNVGPTVDSLFASTFFVTPLDTDSVHSLLAEPTLDFNQFAYFRARGLPAIAFLLQNTPSDAQRTLLSRYVSALASKTQSVRSAWAANTVFASDASQGNESSFSKVVNGWMQSFEELKSKSIGAPAGVFDLGIPQPSKLASPHYNNSLALAFDQWKQLKAFYLGKGLSSGDFTSFSQILQDLKYIPEGQSKQLDIILQEKFTLIDSAFAALISKNLSLQELLVSDKASVKALFDLFTDATASLKVDMLAGAFSASITYADNDGD